VCDLFNSNNIGGFNLANFKMRYLNDFLGDVIHDYEQSFMGSFIKELMVGYDLIQKDSEDLHVPDLYMAITKFENEVGYSLLEGDLNRETDENEYNDHVSPGKIEKIKKLDKRANTRDGGRQKRN